MRRRAVLKTVGGVALTAGVLTGTAASWSRLRQADSPPAILNKVGHSTLSNPGKYAQGSLGPDGRYAVVGSWVRDGSFLVDLSDPADPTERHHLPETSDGSYRNLDVKVDPRGGLYYRTREPTADEFDEGSDGPADRGDVQVIDYGFDSGTPTSPELVGRIASPLSHNMCPHPDEPLLYVVNLSGSADQGGVEVWDVSDPTAPTQVGTGFQRGPLHDVVVDAERDLLHCATFLGYGILDISEPTSPEELGWFAYDEQPDYTAIGEPGFEDGHLARPDPERDLVVVGDEVTPGVPGGKHIFDIGWDEGSPEDPRPIGFTHSPNAQVRDEDEETFWTTHNHDVVPGDERTLLVSGDYSEGVVLYDITDPREPTPIDRYPTDDGADEVEDGQPAPWAWSAQYCPEREFVFVSDSATGVYTFELEEAT